MSLIACGINHKTAPLPLREKVIFAKEQMPSPLLELVEKTKISEAIILSTCNRTELYCTGSEVTPIVEWLYQHRQLPQKALDSCLYVHQDKFAVQHLLRVAAGLDSMVLGEPQIFGQLKSAYSVANVAGTIGKNLKHLFQYIFSVSKRVRTETVIGCHPVSVASAAVDLAKHIFADPAQLQVLLVGVGEMTYLLARHLRALGVHQLWIANRTLEHAEQFARTMTATAIPLDKISTVMTQVDMVVTATGSSLPIIGKGMVERALKQRKHRLLFMVDLAVPRDIESEVGDLADVYLYTLDDLQNIIQRNLQDRHSAAQQAEELIHAHATHYMRSLQILEAVPLIRSYREQADAVRSAALADVIGQLAAGALTPEEALKRLAHRLTNKLLHVPTQQLRQAAYAEEEEVLKIAQRLLGL